LLLSAAAVWLVGWKQPSTSSHESKNVGFAPGEIGSLLPDFSVEDLHGHEISSADLRGKVVLIDFWATWCQPCRQEMPGLQKLLDRYGSRRLAIVGFKFSNMEDTEDPMVFAKKIGVHYPLAVATEGLQEKFGGIEGLPTTLLYDRQGVLRKKVIGFEYTETIESELKPLFDGAGS
jgi:thiol-disulfide isomerase/thioredoxin